MSKTRNNEVLPLQYLLDLNTVHYHLEQVHSFHQQEKTEESVYSSRHLM